MDHTYYLKNQTHHMDTTPQGDMSPAKASPNPSSVVPKSGWMLHWCSLGFGLGLARTAPGTWGSLPGIILGCVLSQVSLRHHFLISILGILGFCLFAWGCIAFTEKKWLGHDHKAIVIDEVAGQALALMFLPMHIQSIVFGFFFFRLFDIWKPGPIRAIDQRPTGAWATLADDLIAGGLAAAATWVVLFLDQTYLLSSKVLGLF